MQMYSSSGELPKKIQIDPLLWLIPLILSGLGILMITSTTSPSSFKQTGTPFAMGARQLLWLLISLLSMLIMYSIPIQKWRKVSAVFWLLSLMLVVASLIPGIGSAVGGARRWIRIGGFSIQPVEMLILSVAIHLPKIMMRQGVTRGNIFMKTLIFLSLSAFPVMFQPDLGSAVSIYLLGMGVFVERHGWQFPLLSAIGGIAGLAMMVIAKPYRMRRIVAFVNPWSDPLDTGFQAIQGLIAFANGGALGTGLGHGFQKLEYLPAAYTDYIYAALGEELGLVGTLLVLFLFAFWISRCRRLYERTESDYRASMVWAVVLTVAIPLFVNVGGVTKLLPMTGLPLPFLSSGGTSLAAMWMRVGILLRLYREHMLGDFESE